METVSVCSMNAMLFHYSSVVKRNSTKACFKNRQFLGALVIGLNLSVAASHTEKKPNFVFVMADDLGWQDVSFMGSSYFETPNLDALAKESVVFKNAFMYPTCSPSRAALLTGRHSFRTGSYCVPVLERGKPADNVFSRWTVGEEHPLYSQPLSAAGYKMIHLGKWHIVGPLPMEEERSLAEGKSLDQPENGNFSWLPAHRTEAIRKYYPTGRGFLENVGGTWWGDPARGHEQGYNTTGGGYTAPYKNPFIEGGKDGEWLTDRLTTDAISFMERNKEQPFFVNLHYYAPHRPSIARSEELLKHFRSKKKDPNTGQGKGKNIKETAEYATMVKSLDDNVGRLISALDEMGIRENTIFIFTSDNGFNGVQSRNDNLRGSKGNVYDGGLRVPLLVNWMSTLSPREERTPVQGLDHFPTFLELAGIKSYNETLDGESLVPLLNGKAFSERSLFWHIASRYRDAPCSIIRKGKWKLIQFLLDGKVELYNTKEDLAEAKNLVELHPVEKKQLLEELLAWRKENAVPLPESSILEY